MHQGLVTIYGARSYKLTVNIICTSIIYVGFFSSANINQMVSHCDNSDPLDRKVCERDGQKTHHVLDGWTTGAKVHTSNTLGLTLIWVRILKGEWYFLRSDREYSSLAWVEDTAPAG